jgi:hypothetical protein
MDGASGQPASFGDRILTRPAHRRDLRSGTDFQFEQEAGIDFRWPLPARIQICGERASDDFDIRMRSVLLEDSGYLLGVSLGCLLGAGASAFAPAYHQTIRYHTHTDYPLSARDHL